MLGRISGDLETTARTCFPPEINISMSLEAAMLRYCTIMASREEGAGTQARDSARPAARRPGPKNWAGAVSVLGRPQRRLRAGERVPFYTKIHFLSRVSFTNRHHGKERHGAGECAQRRRRARDEDEDFCVRQEG